MRKNVLKLLSVLLCFFLCLSFVACGKSENGKADPDGNIINSGKLDCEFKFSKDCSNWLEVKADSEFFRDGGSYLEKDTEIVYLHFKNHNDHPIVNKVNFRVVDGESKDAVIGVVDAVRVAFPDTDAALTAIDGNAARLESSYIYSQFLEADSTSTVAVVLSMPSAATMKIRVTLDVIALENGDKNSSVIENDFISVYADTYCFADKESDTVLTNDDTSFKAELGKGAVSDGAVVSTKVTPASLGKCELKYNITFKVDGAEYSGTNAFKVSLLSGYGLEGVQVFDGDTKIDSTYGQYSGLVEFSVNKSCCITIRYTGELDLKGVVVGGSQNLFDTFHEAVNYAAQSVNSEIVNFVVFGRVEYTVATGEKIDFVGNNKALKTVNVRSGNSTAEIFITKESGSVPSLPYATNGIQINYSNMTFDGDNELQEGGEYSRHFDYRGEADISFKGCTFKKALATRGPSSNVVIKNCDFKCPTYEDTFKGYCYYSVQKIGGGEIKVELLNNDFTGCLGGINLDWSEGDFIVTDNKFGGYNCTKPAIQLSHATTMLIENNSFSNITDENAFRFYKGYNGVKTSIINNTFEKVAYLFQSDVPNAMLQLKDFEFKNNIISKDVNLTMGHNANSTADDIGPHGYTVDTALNTIK